MNKVEKRTIFCLLRLMTLISQIELVNLLAQDRPIKFERIGLEQGLSQNTVYCILQDHQGFLWFSTQDGLNKYDGYNFTAYKQDVFDSTSISGNVVWTIYEDHTGTLWVGTWGGLNRFDREKEQFSRFVYDPNNPHSLSHDRVNAIYEDHSGTLWVGTGNGLNKFDRNEERFSRFMRDPNNPNSLSSDAVLTICEDNAGVLWIGTGNGLNKFDRSKEQFTRFVNDPKNPHSLSHNAVWKIYVDRTGTLWVGTLGGGLNKFDHVKEHFARFVHAPNNPHSLSHNIIRSIYEDRSGTLWIGTVEGLNKFDRNKEQFTRFFNDSKNSKSLSENRIWSIYEDRAGILWIGTFFKGLNKLDREKEQFIQFVNDPEDPHTLSHNVVNSFYQDRTGTLWVGTVGGLSRLSLDNRDARQFTHFFHDSKNPQSLSNNNARPIIEDHTGALWVGTTGDGLNRFDRNSGQFTRFVHDPKNPHSLSHNNVWSICEDHTGTLWIGTQGGGLNKFDRAKEQFIRFVNDPKNTHSLSNNIVWAICEDSASPHTLWLATNGGLDRFDYKTEQFTHFVHDPKNSHSLSHNQVSAIYEDLASPNVLWVGTMGGGLNRFDRNTQQFTYYTEKDGLSSNTICGILKDDRGRLWLSTSIGLSRFDPSLPAGKNFHNYDIVDGLPSNEFMVGAKYESKSGEMFFGSFDGFIAFHPDSIKDNPHIPPVVITSFKRYNTDDAGGIAIEEKGISAKKEVQVSYKDNILNFEFAALNYRNTLKNQYAYKLEGFNDNWIQLGTKREVTFTNLDPGEYTLRVKGSNNNGVWNEEGTSLKITITPPWGRTRWAYAFYVLLFTALLYGWRRFELNRVKLRNELKMKNFEAQKLQEMDQMKSRFFANISHEFRTPLTLILGPVEQIRAGQFRDNLNEACDMILRNGQRLLRLINQLLDLARIEAGRMTLQTRPENIVSFLKGLVLSFASAAERKRIKLSITAEEENLIVYFDRDKLEKIVSNLLSNALKFTPEEGSVIVGIEGCNSYEEKSLRGVPTFFVGATKQSAIDEREGLLRPAEKRGTKQ